MRDRFVFWFGNFLYKFTVALHTLDVYLHGRDVDSQGARGGGGGGGSVRRAGTRRVITTAAADYLDGTTCMRNTRTAVIDGAAVESD